MYTSYFNRFGYLPPVIQEKPKDDLDIIVVIPCFNEPDIDACLSSLCACNLPAVSVEVIIVINAPENSSAIIKEQNAKSKRIAQAYVYKNLNNKLRFFIIEQNELPTKHAGVGLARKIGMDEAAYRFSVIKNFVGKIVCFDADCTCAENYLSEIYNFTSLNPTISAASIYFEHALSGKKFPDAVYNAITSYELHLRYYKQALQYAKFPYAYHTIGSCMFVCADAYMQQGGMNKRKAGEDFYFLQKHIPLGRFAEINSTCVYPSPRQSNRVPFGTGKAISNILIHNNFTTYNFQSFKDLKIFFISILNGVYNFNEFPLSIKKFIKQEEWNKKIEEIKNNSTTEIAFVKRFFNWFDALMVLKFIHFSRNNFYSDVSVNIAANELLRIRGITGNTSSEAELLMIYREIDRLAENRIE